MTMQTMTKTKTCLCFHNSNLLTQKRLSLSCCCISDINFPIIWHFPSPFSAIGSLGLVKSSQLSWVIIQSQFSPRPAGWLWHYGLGILNGCGNWRWSVKLQLPGACNADFWRPRADSLEPDNTSHQKYDWAKPMLSYITLEAEQQSRYILTQKGHAMESNYFRNYYRKM